MATKQVIFSGTRDNPSTSATEYSSLMGDGNQNWNPTEANHEAIISTPGKLTNLKVGVGVAPGAEKSWVFTIRKAASGAAMADTALSVTISNAAVLSGLDTDEVTVAAGERVTISATPSGTPTAAVAVYWTCEFIPDTSGETILLSNTAGSSLVGDRYNTLVGGKYPDTPEFEAQTLFPTAATLKKFYVELTNAPGEGTSRIFTIRKNGVATGLVVTISDTNTTGNDTDPAHNVSIAAGDSVSIASTISGVPSSSSAKFGIVFLPDTPGEFITCATTDDWSNSTNVEYEHLTCGDASLTTTETEQHNLARACTAKKMYVALATAPGNGYTWTFTLRQNLADKALVVSIAGTDKTGNAATDVAISNDDLLDTAIDARAGAEVSATQIAYLFYIAPIGGVTHYGAATLSGSGTLAGIGRGIFIGKSTLSGTGTLAAIGRRIFTGSATLAGLGTLTANAVLTVIGKAVTSGVGTLSAIGTVIEGGVIKYGSALLSGVGTLTASGVRVFQGAVTLAGSGTLAGIGHITAIGKATLSGVGTLAAIAGVFKLGAATLTGVGTLVASGVITAIGKATLSGTGTLSAIGRGIFVGAATLAGTGTLRVIGNLGRILRVVVVTTHYRAVNAITTTHRQVNSITTYYRKVKVATTHNRLVNAITTLYRKVKAITTGG